MLSYIVSTLALLKKETDASVLDAETFYRLVLMARAIAVTRPHNLTKLTSDNAQAQGKWLI